MNLIDYNFRLNSIIKEGALGTNEIALMFVIINLQNSLKSELFGLPTRTTSAHLNLSLPTYYRALENLQKKGLIQIVEQGKKNQAPIIRITFNKNFLSHSLFIPDSPKNEPKEKNEIHKKIFSESVNINNKEERIKNKEEIINIKPEVNLKKTEIPVPKSTMEPVEKVDLSQMNDYLAEQITINLYLLKQATTYDIDKLIKSIEPFLLHQQLQGTKYIYKKDVYKHYARWIQSFDIDRDKQQPKQTNLSTDDMVKKLMELKNKKTEQ